MHYDIFCKIVDNFGDIGVCWRLAKQLANAHDLRIRLFIDDFSVASKIIPSLNINKTTQFIENVEISPWPVDSTQPANVVIETFACGLPEAYLHRAAQQKSLWINLDYLSAEDWVNVFHAKPSPHPTLPITKHFFFPGFTANTGGLIREKNLLVERDAFLASTQQQAAFWQKLGVQPNEHAIKISLFCYAQADLAGLFSALNQYSQPIQLVVPENSLIANFIANNIQLAKNIQICQLPFLSQDDYDKLLWACDLNFVRGEDSWIRAIWAGKPFIWQPYIQTENTHLTKLEAFINLYYKSYEQKEMVWKAHKHWAAGHGFGSALENYLKTLKNTAAFCQQQSMLLAQQTDLATRLVAFANCNT
ncbi:MAG TPA: elongation factor P maturation arginine rhamnosyltransferase EarP [Methylotenera sp.]|nr:elongation factor P maturation arginine rhamnosyltransferase EarP [Methylotenera sp.]HPH04361.1 elongation factor P maturation arginine rhamnosyltransferase EarP [Methylotenera sp.]HPM99915.1 elongation factor P maturation arginine rhamnosyltransferase EarP [Methylotenera sp.]